MKLFRLSLVICFSSLFIVSASAQVMFDYLRAADDYYKKGDYNSATIYYEKYIKMGGKKGIGNYEPYQVKQVKMQKSGPVKLTSRQEAIYKLAESYRKLNNYAEALQWYKEATEWHQQFPDAKYWYAVSLRTTGDFENAEKAFTDYLATSASNEEYKKAAEKELANLKFINEQLKRPEVARFTVAKKQALQATATYAPVANNNMVVFTASTADTTQKKKTVYINNLYSGYFTDGALSSIQKISFGDNSTMHEGVASITADGNKIYFTRWTGTEGKKLASVYVAEKSAGSWANPVPVTAVNVEGFSSQEPMISPDGNYLIFSSNMPGGEGGFDLYYVQMQNGTVAGKPVNMGKSINTAQNEQAPFYHARTKTFVFSSNGRVGMGGMDFYKATGELPSSLSEPVNMGYPYNSVKDDIYFTASGRNLYNNILFSSDRGSACCLELFGLERSKLAKHITGRVINCKENKTLDSTSLVVTDASGNVVDTLKTDENGNYSLTLADFKNLSLQVQRQGFIPATGSIAAPNEDLDIDSMTAPDICMEPVPIPENKPIVLTNIYFEFAKADIKPESFEFLDSLASFMLKYPTMAIEISGHTDNIGSDEKNQKLSEDRAAAVVKYLTDKGIKAENMQSIGYGETKPVAPNKKPSGKDDPEGRAKNRRIEFKVLHY